MLRVSVLMPTYGQAHFIPRAVESLLAQSLADWELVVVDDGSPDGTGAAVAPYLADPRVTYHRLKANGGLGAALNYALERARALLVAYLPSDDVYYRDHLADVVAVLDAGPAAVLAYSGLRHHYNRLAGGQLEGEPLQLAQVLHRRGDDRWPARDELESDDLEQLFWRKLRPRGAFLGTGKVTCEWVDHPDQRHKVMREPLGGVNPFRVRYNVATPLRFRSSHGNPIDEAAHYRRFRARPDTPPAADGLTIVLAGELAYNPERVLALEERGHRLYGLWTPEPMWFNTVGPLPFGHVRDLPRQDWPDAVRRLKPDLIYALLNWQTVSFAHQVLEQNPGVPFVWHFKEGPFICLERGLWRQLLDLYTRCDGAIYCGPEMRDWFVTVAPETANRVPTLLLDGDLPKQEWFTDDRAPLLSDADGQIHTVVPGRPIGLHPHTVAELAAEGVHLHFYGDFTQGQWVNWIAKVREVAPGRLHLHPNADQEHWVAEFSRYDAGWLHFVRSENGGELRRANWDDLNYPARIGTYAAAGLPMLQYDNPGAVMATQTLSRQRELGPLGADIPDLAAQLRDRARMARYRDSVWRQRHEFTFDHHADRLVEFFRQVIASRRS